jgi:hypothetical protein
MWRTDVAGERPRLADAPVGPVACPVGAPEAERSRRRRVVTVCLVLAGQSSVTVCVAPVAHSQTQSLYGHTSHDSPPGSPALVDRLVSKPEP